MRSSSGAEGGREATAHGGASRGDQRPHDYGACARAAVGRVGAGRAVPAPPSQRVIGVRSGSVVRAGGRAAAPGATGRRPRARCRGARGTPHAPPRSLGGDADRATRRQGAPMRMATRSGSRSTSRRASKRSVTSAARTVRQTPSCAGAWRVEYCSCVRGTGSRGWTPSRGTPSEGRRPTFRRRSTGCEVAGHNRGPEIPGRLSRARPTRVRSPPSLRLDVSNHVGRGAETNGRRSPAEANPRAW